ncbi:MAG: thiamine phosphate synthase [Cytophagaceae bacterium]
MKLAVFSLPDYHEGEEEVVKSLFEEGLEHFHLRKPGWEKEQVLGYLRNLHPSSYRNIIIHNNYDLIQKYNLKGIHLPGTYIENANSRQLNLLIKEAQLRGLRVTGAAHSMDEVKNCKIRYESLFLSPLFDSISKEGYKSGFILKDLGNDLIEYKKGKKYSEIWALGGITEKNLCIALQMGFAGAGILGAVWNEFKNKGKEAAVTVFKNLKHTYVNCKA